jgi:hypothetical protein
MVLISSAKTSEQRLDGTEEQPLKKVITESSCVESLVCYER